MPVITLIIIGLTVAVSLAAFNDRALRERLILWPVAVRRRHEYWRLLSHGLIHDDGLHLFFNMFTLYFVGRAMEGYLAMKLGMLGLPLLYLGGMLVSALPSYFKYQHDSRYSSLGASGGVAAVLFAFILLAPGATIRLIIIPMPALVFGIAYLAYSWYMDRRSSGNIDHNAHLWGAGFGLLFMALLEPGLLTSLLR